MFYKFRPAAVPALTLAAFLFSPSVALAQSSEPRAEPFFGVTAGLHDIGLTDVDEDVIDDGGAIFGFVAGIDFALVDGLFVGVEGNFNAGTDAINSEYGASVRLGAKTASGSKFYLRGGFQEVDFDIDELLNLVGVEGISSTDDDFLVGAGAEFPLGPGSVRLNFDTIAFDTVRVTSGYIFTF